MKSCGKCKRSLPSSEFHRAGERLQPWCKACKAAYAQAYYQRCRNRLATENRRRKREAAAWFRELKAGRPCTDCGGVFHPAAMEWDHPPGAAKLADVGSLYGGSRDRVLKEIAKCELVCANCHAVRTYRRRTEPDPAIVASADRMLRT